jgi:hypothetical protein
MTEAVVFTDPDDENDEGCDQRRCVVATPNNVGEIALSVLGSDQDATEFLTQDQWSEFVRAVNTMMGWMP